MRGFRKMLEFESFDSAIDRLLQAAAKAESSGVDKAGFLHYKHEITTESTGKKTKPLVDPPGCEMVELDEQTIIKALRAYTINQKSATVEKIRFVLEGGRIGAKIFYKAKDCRPSREEAEAGVVELVDPVRR